MNHRQKKRVPEWLVWGITFVVVTVLTMVILSAIGCSTAGYETLEINELIPPSGHVIIEHRGALCPDRYEVYVNHGVWRWGASGS